VKIINALIFIAVFASAIYLAFMLGKPVFMYRAFKADVVDMTRMDIIKDKYEFKKKVLDKAKEYGLSIKPENVRVSGNAGAYKVNIAWTELVYVFSKEYNFALDAP
jgi:hypothetical protein